MTEQLGITQWAAMGAKCYGGMNQWGDDIDMHVLDCTTLNDLYANGDSKNSDHYPALDPNTGNSHSHDHTPDQRDHKVVAVNILQVNICGCFSSLSLLYWGEVLSFFCSV